MILIRLAGGVRRGLPMEFTERVVCIRKFRRNKQLQGRRNGGLTITNFYRTYERGRRALNASHKWAYWTWGLERAKKKYICTFIISELLAIYPVLLPGEQFPISGVSFVARLCVPGLLPGVVSLEASSPRCGFPIIWLHSLVYLTLIERQT